MVKPLDIWINARIYTPNQVIDQGCLIVNSSGTIEAIGDRQLLNDYPTSSGANVHDQEGKIVVPGFIDVHVHGGNGYQMMDATNDAVNGMSRFHAQHGTTAFLATTTTLSHEQTLAALRNVVQCMESGIEGAELLGIHLEGPYLNAVRCGAQDTANIRAHDPHELEQFIEASEGHMRLVTLAPEQEGGLAAVKSLVERGITVAIGHSNATYQEVEAAIKAGVTHTTHHFNGMSPFHHRDPGVAGAGMLKQELTTQLIVDGIHVHPDLVKLMFEIKGADHICMITDAVAYAGMPDGDYGKVVKEKGEVYLADKSTLAGSSLTMDQALRNAVQFTGLPIESILPAMTRVPAEQIGVSGRKGSLERGKDADFVVLDQQLQVQATVVKGKQIYSV